MFINLSNHPSRLWGEKQYKAASFYGEVVDLQFPQIDPDCDEKDISNLVEDYFMQIQKYANPVVMVQGEFSFTYGMVEKLKSNGIIAVTSCSRRNVLGEEIDAFETIKTSAFEFVKFRKY